MIQEHLDELSRRKRNSNGDRTLMEQFLVDIHSVNNVTNLL